MTWKILFGLGRLCFDVVLVWMLLGRSGSRGFARVRGDGTVEFAKDWLGFWASPLIIAYLIWLGAKDIMRGHENLWDLFNPVVFGSFALLLLFSFPGFVVVTAGGLEQIYWFRKNKRIGWKDIEEIETSTKDPQITITAADGTKITHSGQLADRSRFLMELKQHCGEDLPKDFPREPIDPDAINCEDG